MGRFSGKIGFCIVKETTPGVFMPSDPEERIYHGDVINRKVRLENGDGTNTDFTLNHDISIVADKFAKENIGFMKYVVLHGIKWEITSVTITNPRIQLSLGGVYNG